MMVKELDNCEICKGTKGGVKGNENIVMCDYCTVEYEDEKKRLNKK